MFLALSKLIKVGKCTIISRKLYCSHWPARKEGVIQTRLLFSHTNTNKDVQPSQHCLIAFQVVAGEI